MYRKGWQEKYNQEKYNLKIDLLAKKFYLVRGKLPQKTSNTKKEQIPTN